MTMMKMFVLAALVATIASLIAGIASMAKDEPVGHLSSAQWMTSRVAFQALALLLLVVALIT